MNISYFAGATKEEITTSGQLVAGLLFRNVYGPPAERTLDVFIAISSLGGVLIAVCLLSCHLAGTRTDLNGRYFRKAVSIKLLARRAFYLLAISGHPTVLLMRAWLESLFVSLLPFNSALSFLILRNRLVHMRDHYICTCPWRRIQLCCQPRSSCNLNSPLITH